MGAQDFVKGAKDLLTEAEKEFERALKEENKILFRDASEKAWLAVVEATNYLFLTHGITPPKSHWERRRRLDELEEKDFKVRELGLRDRFAARDYHLHQLGFYEGLIDENLMKIELEKVRKYIEDIEKLG